MKPERMLRIDEIIDETPNGPPILPLSRSAFYAAIRRGELPKPKKIGRTSLWFEYELREAMAALK